MEANIKRYVKERETTFIGRTFLLQGRDLRERKWMKNTIMSAIDERENGRGRMRDFCLRVF